MKIAIIGASGRQGGMLLKEAVARGHEVTAIDRKDSKSPLLVDPAKRIKKDILELAYSDLEENDVIINAFGTWSPDTYILHQTTLKHLADILSEKPNRLIVVGGAGSLFVNPEHTMKVFEQPDFPETLKPLAESQSIAFDAICIRDDVRWTYLSPAENFVFEGEKTGQYKVGKDDVFPNSKGLSQVSYADYAIAMIDEAENGNHIKARFTVVSG